MAVQDAWSAERLLKRLNNIRITFFLINFKFTWSQNWHWNGFSPVWTLECAAKLLAERNLCPHKISFFSCTYYFISFIFHYLLADFTFVFLTLLLVVYVIALALKRFFSRVHTWVCGQFTSRTEFLYTQNLFFSWTHYFISFIFHYLLADFSFVFLTFLVVVYVTNVHLNISDHLKEFKKKLIAKEFYECNSW